jgi:hypothetical protein
MDFPDAFLDLPTEEQHRQVCARAKSELISIFKVHNLAFLIDEVHMMKLHLHGPLVAGTNYACDHVH